MKGDITLLWGVRLYSGDDRPSGLLFKTWNGIPREPLYDGEPTEPLLFRTRKQAETWCLKRNAEYKASRNPIVKSWRVKVCRVRRTVEVME